MAESHNPFVRDILNTLMRGESLAEPHAERMMTLIMEGALSEAQIAGILVALRMKKETPVELAAMARVMRDFSIRIQTPDNTIDTCGTGGDHSRTFNVSTAAALLCAASGIPVAKHGNRSFSSASGSADVLEALGIRVDLSPDQVQQEMDATNFCFMFAPKFHPAMKNVVPVRRALQVQTAFNQLGPLTNPGRVRRQLLGVSQQEQVTLLAEVLAGMGHERAWVVRGEDGVDEISLSSPTVVQEVQDGHLADRTVLEPDALGLKHAGKAIPTVDSAKQSAEIIRNVFAGKETGPARDVVVFNAAAAAVVSGAVESIREGIDRMQDTLTSGNAERLVAELVNISAPNNAISPDA